MKPHLIENNFSIDILKNIVTCDICVDDLYSCLGGYEKQAGIFSFDFGSYLALSDLERKQVRIFINLKKSLLRHMLESQTHQLLKDKKEKELEDMKKKEKRNTEIGLNLFRLRYNGIKQGDSYRNFEQAVLTAHLNKVDTGDINNSVNFGRDLTKHIKKAMQSKLAENLSLPVDGTKEKRPVGIVAGKITPNKRTGHIIGLIVPAPENPLSGGFLIPVLLETPPVKDHTAEGLAQQVLDVVHAAGVEDHQVQGGGVDGQYILMGVWGKLLAKLDLGQDRMTPEDLQQWITIIWEPAHNINLADGDIRGLDIFDWHVTLTSCVGEVTSNLGIGKGLEQCFEEAESQEQKFFKFKAFSKTRFASHAESCFFNFEKNFGVTVPVLLERLDSGDTKVRDTAHRLLNSIKNITFCASLCGVVDIYAQLAKISCSVQQVEQFPFEMKSKLVQGIKDLNKMSKLSLSSLDTAARKYSVCYVSWCRVERMC